MQAKWWLAAGLCLWAGIGGCARPRSETPARWETGFWVWEGLDAAARTEQVLDVAYVKVGDLQTGRFGGAYLNLRPAPEYPAARSYWLTVRSEERTVPGAEWVEKLGESLRRVLGLARMRGWQVAGVQLDLDCPTGQLRSYAKFLQALRKELPAGTELSITALLDWFREGTEMAAVAEAVDEFVPQFYDVDRRDRTRIASEVRADWGPRFERYGKRYRIGISAFGRARWAEPGWSAYAPDAAPYQVARAAGFALQYERNAVGETVLHYRAERQSNVQWRRFEPGTRLDFVLPTEDSIGRAVTAARKMGPHCGGVLFFRWPGRSETLAAAPAMALRAAGVQAERGAMKLETAERGCALVWCTDLFLDDPEPLREHRQRYAIRSSQALEYFLPKEDAPVRLRGEAALEVDIPPFGGERRMYLGRAVSQQKAEFRMEEVR